MIVSIFWDMYVDIVGYDIKDKINYVYVFGGVVMVMDIV